MPASPALLLLLALGAIAVLVLLVTWRKMNGFLALFLASLVVGIGAGIPPLAVLKHFQDGLGATMGGIAAVIALGAMLGKLLAESGAAQVLAERFSAFFGPARVGWCVWRRRCIDGAPRSRRALASRCSTARRRPPPPSVCSAPSWAARGFGSSPLAALTWPCSPRTWAPSWAPAWAP